VVKAKVISVVNTRNRVVYFRITEAEFERLSALCGAADGRRSVSELARTAVQELLASASREQQARSEPILQVAQSVQVMERKIEQVLALLESSKKVGITE